MMTGTEVDAAVYIPAAAAWAATTATIWRHTSPKGRDGCGVYGPSLAWRVRHGAVLPAEAWLKNRKTALRAWCERQEAILASGRSWDWRGWAAVTVPLACLAVISVAHAVVVMAS